MRVEDALIVRDAKREEDSLSLGSNATQTQACLPLILIIVSSTKIVRTRLRSTSNLSQMGASRWTHLQIETWLLRTNGSKAFDALINELQQ